MKPIFWPVGWYTGNGNGWGCPPEANGGDGGNYGLGLNGRYGTGFGINVFYGFPEQGRGRGEGTIVNRRRARRNNQCAAA
jgi:hypothetical protein